MAWLIGYCSQYAKLVMVDGGGNVHFQVQKGDTASRTLFVAHTDTMSYRNPLKSNTYGILGRTLHAMDNDVLGADNGAGCTMMCWLMANGVPGRYIFTRAEEVGGVGAKYLAETFEDLLLDFDRAITFDRRGTSDIITHQGGERCCSDEFAEALADQLNMAGENLLYMSCDRGVYTDTKEFIYQIPECTNISVGYAGEHGEKELLDLIHYKDLAQAALQVNWESLPVTRSPWHLEEFAPGHVWGTHTPGPYTDEERTYDNAIRDWKSGDDKPLKKLICKQLHPSMPEAAEKFIDMKKLTPSVINGVAFQDWEWGIEKLVRCVVVNGATAPV